jgi:hypothetical protein
MKPSIGVMVIVVSIIFLVSCVQVTTTRQSLSGFDQTGGSAMKTSMVKVYTAGWDAFGIFFKALALPFKITFKAIKLIF